LVRRTYRKLISVVLFLLFACVCSAQVPNSALVGKWNYAGVQPVDSDPWSQRLIDIMIGKNSYKQFYANNLYAVHENDTTTYGRWELIDNGHKVVTTSYSGDIRTFEITKITNDTLIFLGKKKIYGTLIKDVNASEDFVGEPSQNSITVRATAKQIRKKWILKDIKLITTPTEAEKMANRIFAKALQSSWYEFKSEGIALSKFTSLKTLKWYFANTNKSIVMVDENGDGVLWNVIAITNSQLILQKPHASSQLVFEAEE